MLQRQTLERFRAGDGAAFAEVVAVHDDVVRRIASGYWRSTFEREEAMQEVWLHVYRNRAAFDLDRLTELPGWIAVLARRRCLDLVRKKQPDVRPFDEGAHAPVEDAPDGPGLVERKALLLAVDAFEARLAPAWRAFFRLCFVDGHSYQEIGAQLGYGALRCKYMKKVLAQKARKNRGLMEALGRYRATAAQGSTDAR